MTTVSVIIPTFNRPEMLRAAVASVLALGRADVEIIVVDDGSNPPAKAVLEPLHPSVHYFYQDNQGESAARNFGLRQATERYVAFLDDDDLWLPNKLDAQIAALEAEPPADVVSSPCRVIDGEGHTLPGQEMGGKPLPETGALAALVLNNHLALPGVLIRRSALDATHGFDEAITWSEDWLLFMQLAAAGARFRTTEDVVAAYRMHSQGHLPRKQYVMEHLNDPVAALDRIFESTEAGRALPEALKQQAHARRHGLAALVLYALGEEDTAQVKLARAAALDPEKWAAPGPFAATLAGQAATFAQGWPAFDAETFIGRVYAHLPPDLEALAAGRRQATAAAFVELGFAAHAAGDGRRAGRLMAVGVRAGPGWLRNRGVRSILARGVVAGNG